VRLTRASLSALALLVGLTGAVRAAEDGAVQTVRGLYASFESALKSGPSDVGARLAAVGPAMAERFDFPAMARTAVGQKWKSFSAEQQAAVTEAFGRYFTTSYANRLKQAAGGKFEVMPKSEARGANRLVQTRVTSADGDESQIDFVVNAANRVQDVLLNGNVSEVASQRNALADPLKAGGAEGVIRFLRSRTDGMLAAKPAP
jgi:phospholipid transport system substrate-binding protein